MHEDAIAKIVGGLSLTGGHHRAAEIARRATRLNPSPYKHFGREVEYLRSKGYTFKPDGTAVKVK